MTHNRLDILCCILILFTAVISTKGDFQDLFSLQRRGKHLPETKFESSDYEDYSDVNEPIQAPSESLWSRTPLRDVELPLIQSTQQLNQLNVTSPLDPHIKWDKNWGANLDYGQLSAVDLDLNGNIVLFCRRERIWGQDTFDLKNVFNRNQGPIKDNTIIMFNKSGKVILEWGRNMFYLPHGLTIDFEGNYWITDVAMHQVFKFNAQDIEKNKDKLKKLQNSPQEDFSEISMTVLFSQSIIKPSMILGEAFVPGNDNQRFCKPTAVAVARNGDFFVSDGYCNSRIVKFNSKGERILIIGRALTFNKFLSPYTLSIPHDLTLADDRDHIYVADREHGRVLCYFAGNGTFHKEFRSPVIGTKIYGVAYARERLYLVNGPDPFSTNKFHVRGFVIDVHSGDVISQFGPNGDMIAPHDIAVSDDGSEIYVPELYNHAIYRFLSDESFREIKMNVSKLKSSIANSSKSHHSLIPLTDNSDEKSSGHMNLTTLIMTIVVSIMILIGLCVGIAAIVARCKKRVRRRDYWMNERKDNFKLSSLFDTRQTKNFRLFDKRPNTRDFSKLSTEPETTDDEHVEDSLII
ncbi:peptidyl-alpha-hydroxyglycine alpha-amidating lyase 2-like isoform X2 [Chelonus insularis]|uniref:peptidyl-alpha-hydroxyglycine alpha-amidating lyase 2-like isoform X2 n=1 Tax=Chelonus insularis TaxID=460826 RepID=UPI00158911F9|nr:peptidyl-alpha-hydroxyglycine alpha-amidating lyase 2-like isoform X2 [Chelonus insularis]